MLPISAAATLACIYEATARKPGNVYPGADFDETTCYAAFVQSAITIGPFMEHAWSAGVGDTIAVCVKATRAAVHTNTNLGTILLIAPLAAVPRMELLEKGIGKVLEGLTSSDTFFAYQAIAAASAGGLGKVPEADVNSLAPIEINLVEAMRLAADRDLVARQYVKGFATVFEAASQIELSLNEGIGLNDAIVTTYLKLLETYPDSLIQRKCGLQLAQEAGERASLILRTPASRKTNFSTLLEDFDHWLRADGNRRNPGTSADLIAAALFVLLREGRLNWSSW